MKYENTVDLANVRGMFCPFIDISFFSLSPEYFFFRNEYENFFTKIKQDVFKCSRTNRH